ncbi:Uncharacterised protein [Mycobacterium tuberculosis]|uniref:Uncharacterized protein n=1 Tax=Mycobacterium tuberculosis TaxID=1773 RepID=A0A654TZT3_MYCTX|nr:Uncharacterised protein [Mycobacterium tuberculosis]CKS32554.1 Uncharacterised protein [Mycobacterium tuberculosis]CKS92519.1 Uncharacterised protein [Mycobacterium tuberculosis]CKT05167.1 Uncharacterised protein [Mycobacterium tuberculosis]CKT39557.1 Uncharacterised protein [Mycobacterium tuberculosis]
MVEQRGADRAEQQSTQCAHPLAADDHQPSLLGCIDKRRHNIGKDQLGMHLRRFGLTQAVGERLAGLLNDLLCVVLLPLSHIRVQLAHRPADNHRGNNVQQGDGQLAHDGLTGGPGYRRVGLR